jgi:hypothetical protein
MENLDSECIQDSKELKIRGQSSLGLSIASLNSDNKRLEEKGCRVRADLMRRKCHKNIKRVCL